MAQKINNRQSLVQNRNNNRNESYPAFDWAKGEVVDIVGNSVELRVIIGVIIVKRATHMI